MSGAAGAGAGGSGMLSDHRLGGEDGGGDGGGVLQRAAADLGRIDDTGGDHIAVLFLRGVKAVAGGCSEPRTLIEDHGTLETGVRGDLA